MNPPTATTTPTTPAPATDAPVTSSRVQLALNVSGIVVAGILTLTIQRWWWSRREMRSARNRSSQAVAEAARRSPRR